MNDGNKIYEPNGVGPNETADPAHATLIRVVQIQGEVHHLRTGQQQLADAIFGNGREGVVTRVDRLEQTDKRRSWFERAVIGAVVALLVGAVFVGIRHVIITQGKTSALRAEHR